MKNERTVSENAAPMIGPKASGYGEIPIAGGDTAMPLSLKKRLDLIACHVHPGMGTKMLDCGCGCGGYVRLLRRDLRVDARGVEYLAEKVAEAKMQPDVAHFVEQGNIEALPFPNGEFDAVLLNEVIEHVPDDLRALKEIHRVLKPGGKLIIFAPNRLYPFETHGVYLRNGSRAVPPWVPLVPYVPLKVGKWIFRYWARNYWPSELRRLVRSAGFEILSTDYIWQTFENISGQQLRIIARFKRFFRSLSSRGERSIFRCFGVSQVVICRK